MVRSHIEDLITALDYARGISRLTRASFLKFLQDQDLLPEDFYERDWSMDSAAIDGDDLYFYDKLGNLRLTINLKDL